MSRMIPGAITAAEHRRVAERLLMNGGGLTETERVKAAMHEQIAHDMEMEAIAERQNKALDRIARAIGGSGR